MGVCIVRASVYVVSVQADTGEDMDESVRGHEGEMETTKHKGLREGNNEDKGSRAQSEASEERLTKPRHMR